MYELCTQNHFHLFCRCHTTFLRFCTFHIVFYCCCCCCVMCFFRRAFGLFIVFFSVLPRPIKPATFLYTWAIVSCTNTTQPPNNIYRWYSYDGLDNVNPNAGNRLLFSCFCYELTDERNERKKKITRSFVSHRPSINWGFVMRSLSFLYMFRCSILQLILALGF